jgi:hypothetical protein
MTKRRNVNTSKRQHAPMSGTARAATGDHFDVLTFRLFDVLRRDVA